MTRRSQFRLDKARARAHVVEGLLQGPRHARRGHRRHPRIGRPPGRARGAAWPTPFDFSEEQANHILDMTLSRLTRLGRSNLEEEMAKLREKIAELEAILDDPAVLRGVITTELTAVRDKFATPRRTEITYDPGDMDAEDLIDDEELVVTMTRAGYIKAVPADAFRTQGRGGRASRGPGLKEEDLVAEVIHTTSHAHLLLFSNRGRVFRLRALRDPHEGAHRAGHGHRQPAPASPRREASRPSSTPGTSPPTATCSSPPSWARSRRRPSASTTSRRREGSSPSTCARATSWSG